MEEKVVILYYSFMEIVIIISDGKYNLYGLLIWVYFFEYKNVVVYIEKCYYLFCNLCCKLG